MIKTLTSVALRRKAIKKLIDSELVENQHALVDLLKKRFDIETTQAVISRDLREMGVTKRSVDNRLIYETHTVDPSREILRLGVLDIEHNEQMIVIKTMPGMAAFVADVIDISDDIGVMGTLSGENVVFVAPRNIKQIKNVFEQLCSILYIKKEQQ